MTAVNAAPLVILLHGVGSRGADLAGLGAFWAADLQGLRFSAPDAPQPFDQGGTGRQWFSIAGVTDQNRPDRIAAARAGLDETLRAIIADHGLTGQEDRVALAGFSQGAIMALDAVASGRWNVGAVVAFSGRLASPLPLAPAQAVPVLLVHGAADPVIPAACLTDAARRLQAGGMTVTAEPLAGIGHTISADGARIAAGFLRRHLFPA